MKSLVIGLSLLVLAACQSAGETFPQRHTADEASYTVSRSSEILVIYIGATNCPPCWTYKERDHPVWIESEEYRHVLFRELSFPRYQRTNQDDYWPEDLRWVREKAYARRGAPRWIVAVDGRIVSNVRGWRRQAFPIIRRLVARKLEQ